MILTDHTGIISAPFHHKHPLTAFPKVGRYQSARSPSTRETPYIYKFLLKMLLKILVRPPRRRLAWLLVADGAAEPWRQGTAISDGRRKLPAPPIP